MRIRTFSNAYFVAALIDLDQKGASEIRVPIWGQGASLMYVKRIPEDQPERLSYRRNSGLTKSGKPRICSAEHASLADSCEEFTW